MATSREIHLAARPNGVPQPTDFALVEVDVPEPADGEVLIRNAYMSVDPSMRPRMNDVKSYLPPFQVGEVMSGGAVGQVVASRNERVPEGSWVTNWLGWREYALSRRTRPDARRSRRRAHLDGARRPRHAGPDRVGRLARHRPAGAGGDGLCLRCSRCGRIPGGADREAEGLPRDRQRRLAREGCVAATSSASTRRSTTARPTRARRSARASTCTSTTSAETTLEVALSALRTHGRVVACGAISQYNATERPPGPRNMSYVVTKRLRLEGFIVIDHFDKFPRLPRRGRPVGARREGGATARPSIEGLERAPEALLGLLTGENIGKMLVKIGPDA